MSIIKIPSSHIYGVGDSNNLVAKNQISQAKLSLNRLNKQVGNVLSKRYVVNYWVKNEEGEYVWAGSNENINEILVNLKPLTNTYLAVPIDENPIEFNAVNYLFDIETGFNGYIKDYTVFRERKWVYPDSESPNGEQERTITETYPPHLADIEYHATNNSFSFDFFNETVFITGNQEELKGITVFVKSNNDLQGYLVSETITIEGKYFESEYVDLNYNTANSISNKFNLPSNELVQEGNTIYGLPFADTALQNVVNKYSKGKEVYTLKCSIANYYDTNGFFAICPTDIAYPATFRKYDIVVPYIHTSQGEVPLSTKADGTAKKFEIIGIDYDYKGVVWQELTIQEYVE